MKNSTLNCCNNERISRYTFQLFLHRPLDQELQQKFPKKSQFFRYLKDKFSCCLGHVSEDNSSDERSAREDDSHYTSQPDDTSSNEKVSFKSYSGESQGEDVVESTGRRGTHQSSSYEDCSSNAMGSVSSIANANAVIRPSKRSNATNLLATEKERKSHVKVNRMKKTKQTFDENSPTSLDQEANLTHQDKRRKASKEIDPETLSKNVKSKENKNDNKDKTETKKNEHEKPSSSEKRNLENSSKNEKPQHNKDGNKDKNVKKAKSSEKTNPKSSPTNLKSKQTQSDPKTTTVLKGKTEMKKEENTLNKVKSKEKKGNQKESLERPRLESGKRIDERHSSIKREVRTNLTMNKEAENKSIARPDHKQTRNSIKRQSEKLALNKENNSKSISGHNKRTSFRLKDKTIVKKPESTMKTNQLNEKQNRDIPIFSKSRKLSSRSLPSFTSKSIQKRIPTKSVKKQGVIPVRPGILKRR